MKIRNTKSILLLILAGSALVLISGCSGDDVEVPEGVASCEGCHTNYAYLQEIYSPDTNVVSGGCGGDVPHYEPYDRVFMGGDGFESYKSSFHYPIGCTGCHGGKDSTAVKEDAHAGDFTAHPSENYQASCGACHSGITNGFTSSLHHGTGQKQKVTVRSGLSGHEEFDQLPAHQIEGYNNNCATCHGTCGNCHVVRPPVAGGGLADGHDFARNPDMINTCVKCHASRGGHAYLGVAPGTKPDIHLTQADFECIDCHSGRELHGNGEPVEHRYAYSELPSCSDCHTDTNTSNAYHASHMDDFNCQVCHSQPYNNCGSCHVHGEGARIPSQQDFKIALNPIPDTKTGFKFVLVRRAPSAPDTWKEYGVDELANFDAFPTYNYTSPHNIQRWTAQTEATDDASCYSNCHIQNLDGELLNKDLFLFEDDLEDWEKSASAGIVVDGMLPAEWNIE